MRSNTWPLLKSACLFAAAGAFALLAACEREPDTLTFIVGRVVDEQGAALPGVEVALQRNGSPDCYSNFYSFGHGPTFDAGTYEPFGSFSSNARGDYLFEMTQRDAQADIASYGAAACFAVTTHTDAATTRLQLQHPYDDLELPDLPRIAQTPTASLSGEAVVLAVPHSPHAAGYDAVGSGFDVHAGDELAWVTWDADGGTTQVSRAVLEDFAEQTFRHVILGLYDRLPPPMSFERYYSAILRVESRAQTLPAMTAVVPLSRGAACAPTAPDGGACQLTDGDLAFADWLPPHGPDAPMTPEPYKPPEEVLIDLGEAKTVRRLLIRELIFSIPAEEVFVETSVDGQAWHRAATLGGFAMPQTHDAWREYTLLNLRASGLYAEVTLDAPAPVRYLRLRGLMGRFPGDPPDRPPSPVIFTGARELSVFAE